MLRFAADENFNLLTHDVTTLTGYAYARVESGKPMPGVFAVGRSVAAAVAIDNLVLIAECSNDGEWEGQVRYLPL